MAINIIEVIISFVTNPWFVLSLLFWVIVLILVYLLRNKKDAIYVFFPILIMMRTKKLNSIIKRMSRGRPKFWRAFWTLGIFISFAFMIFSIYFFYVNLISLIVEPKIENVVTLLIPGVTIDIPVYMYLILPILFVMTTHELAHGISASADGVEIKSTGVLGAGIFYLIGVGAFVEVDERELNSPKFHRNTRLRIAAAGTFVNGVTIGAALILLFLFPILISPFYGKQVTQVDSVLTPDEGGFNHENIAKNDVILALKRKGSSQDYIYLDGDNGITLTSLLNNEDDRITCSVGDYLTLLIYNPTSDEFIEKNVYLGPRHGVDNEIIGVFIGITSHSYYMPLNVIGKVFTGVWPIFIVRELIWLLIISFSMTLFNTLPLPIFDGYRIVKELVDWGIGEDFKSKRKKKDIFLFKEKERNYNLSEYRVDNVDSIKIFTKNELNNEERNEILLGKKNYDLIDKLGDGFKSSITFNLPKETQIKEDSTIEVSYDYYFDEKKPKKRAILAFISLFTTFVVLGNFLLSFIKFGFELF